MSVQWKSLPGSNKSTLYGLFLITLDYLVKLLLRTVRRPLSLTGVKFWNKWGGLKRSWQCVCWEKFCFKAKFRISKKWSTISAVQCSVVNKFKMGVVPNKSRALLSVWVLVTSLIFLIDSANARKHLSLEESIREDPDLSEVCDDT